MVVPFIRDNEGQIKLSQRALYWKSFWTSVYYYLHVSISTPFIEGDRVRLGVDFLWL